MPPKRKRSKKKGISLNLPISAKEVAHFNFLAAQAAKRKFENLQYRKEPRHRPTAGIHLKTRSTQGRYRSRVHARADGGPIAPVGSPPRAPPHSPPARPPSPRGGPGTPSPAPDPHRNYRHGHGGRAVGPWPGGPAASRLGPGVAAPGAVSVGGGSQAEAATAGGSQVGGGVRNAGASVAARLPDQVRAGRLQGVLETAAGALASATLDATGITAVASGALEAYRAGRAELSRRLRPRASTAEHLEAQRVGMEAREREKAEKREAARMERIDRRMREIEAREEVPQGGATTSFFGGVAEAFSAAVSDVAQRAAGVRLPAIQLPTYVPPRSSLLERVPDQAAADAAARRADVAAQPAPAPVTTLLEAEAPSAVAPAGDFADGFPAAPAIPERDAVTRLRARIDARHQEAISRPRPPNFERVLPRAHLAAPAEVVAPDPEVAPSEPARYRPVRNLFNQPREQWRPQRSGPPPPTAEQQRMAELRQVNQELRNAPSEPYVQPTREEAARVGIPQDLTDRWFPPVIVSRRPLPAYLLERRGRMPVPGEAQLAEARASSMAQDLMEIAESAAAQATAGPSQTQQALASEQARLEEEIYFAQQRRRQLTRKRSEEQATRERLQAAVERARKERANREAT